MPPKRSLRSRCPSATAVDAAVSGEPRRKRTRTAKTVPVPQVPVPQLPVPQVPVIPASQELAFPPGLLDTLVARVADEVIRRLTPVYAPTSSTAGVPQPPVVPPIPVTDGSLDEVPYRFHLDRQLTYSCAVSPFR